MLEQVGKGFGTHGTFTDDDARWVQVVVQGTAFAQKFGREDEVVAFKLRTCFNGIANRYGGFDDHHRLRINAHDILNNGLNRTCVEVVGFGIVISRRSDNDIICPCVGFVFIERRLKIEGFVSQVVFNVGIVNGRLPAIEHLDLLRNDVERNYFIVLSEKNGVREPYVTSTGDSDFHSNNFLILLSDSWFINISAR